MPPPPSRPPAAASSAASEENRDPNDFSDIPEDDVDDYLLKEEEVKVKQEIWEELHKDYLKALEEREREEAENIAAGKPPTKVKREKVERETDRETDRDRDRETKQKQIQRHRRR
jgi:hypothetical protein